MEELYCIDPQWLCAMLAKVVTVREKNPFHKNGMRITLYMQFDYGLIVILYGTYNCHSVN